MIQKRHTPGQIVHKLRGAELSGLGHHGCRRLPEAPGCRQTGISEGAQHRWRALSGGLEPNAVQRLRGLLQENARSKKIVADQAVDISILEEVARGIRIGTEKPRLAGPRFLLSSRGAGLKRATSGLPARRATVPTKGSQITSVCDPFFIFLVSGLTPFAEDRRDNARVQAVWIPVAVSSLAVVPSRLRLRRARCPKVAGSTSSMCYLP